MKVGGCFRTQYGAEIYARIQTVISTVQKLQFNPFNELYITLSGGIPEYHVDGGNPLQNFTQLLTLFYNDCRFNSIQFNSIQFNLIQFNSIPKGNHFKTKQEFVMKKMYLWLFSVVMVVLSISFAGCDSIMQKQKQMTSLEAFEKVFTIASNVYLRSTRYSKESILSISNRIQIEHENQNSLGKKQNEQDMETLTAGLITNGEWEQILEASKVITKEHPEMESMTPEVRLIYIKQLFASDEGSSPLSKTDRSCKDNCKRDLAADLLWIGGERLAGMLGCAATGPLASACIGATMGLAAAAILKEVWHYYNCVDSCS